MFLEDEMWFPLVHDYKVENLELFEDNLFSTPFLNYRGKKTGRVKAAPTWVKNPIYLKE